MGLLDYMRDVAQGASNAVSSNVSAPVDLLSWGLRKAGLPIPDAPVGGSQWMRNAGLLQDPKSHAAGLVGETLGLLAGPLAAAKAPQIAAGLLQGGANLAAPTTLSREAGMIYTGQGRIPETLNERAKMRDMLEKYATKSGYEISPGSAFSGASLYSDINNPATGARAIVRISDHAPAMKYVDKNVPYFSVDPTKGEKTSGGTFEQAVKWLGDNGLPINTLGPKYSAQLNAYEAELASFKAQQDAIKNAAIASQKASSNSLYEEMLSNGQRYKVLDQSTKLNSGGRRYDVVDAKEQKKLNFYSAHMPDDVRQGGREAIVEYILKQLGGNK